MLFATIEFEYRPISRSPGRFPPLRARLFLFYYRPDLARAPLFALLAVPSFSCIYFVFEFLSTYTCLSVYSRNVRSSMQLLLIHRTPDDRPSRSVLTELSKFVVCWYIIKIVSYDTHVPETLTLPIVAFIFCGLPAFCSHSVQSQKTSFV